MGASAFSAMFKNRLPTKPMDRSRFQIPPHKNTVAPNSSLELRKHFGWELKLIWLRKCKCSCQTKLLKYSHFWIVKMQEHFSQRPKTKRGMWKCGFDSPPPLLQSQSGPRHSSIASVASSSAPWKGPLEKEYKKSKNQTHASYLKRAEANEQKFREEHARIISL